MRTLARNTLYLLTGLLTYFGLIHIRPPLHYTAQGIALPLTNTSTQAAKHLPRISYHARQGMTPLAWINVEIHTPNPSKASKSALLLKAKQLGQSVGASRVVILGMGFQPPTFEGPMLSGYIFRGEAFK